MLYSKFLIALAAQLSLCLFPLFAQEVRATITGTVSDPSGAPVAGAVIQITNIAQNATTAATTNESGAYLTPYLAPGAYRLSVQQKGFKSYSRTGIELGAQDKLRLDISLEVGDISQSVTVSGEVSLLQTETANRSQTISNALISNLPTQGRNPFQIAWAAPGVVKTGTWRYLRSFDIGGTSGLSINGGRNKENEVLLDGISNVRGDRTVIHVPTMETVQEFKVLSNTYDAQYGRTGGGIVTIVTKAGGNNFHGSFFEYFQSEELNANQSELNSAGIKKPPMNINTFGVTASGPIQIPKVVDLRNRLFWLVSFEGMRQRSADPDVKTFPEMAWRGGDFSTLLNAQGVPVNIYDPLTVDASGNRQPFAGNRLPAARLNKTATEVMKFYPAPTSAGIGPAHVNNYPYPSRWVADMDQWIGRMDWIINSKNSFYFRYGQNPFKEYRALVFVRDPFSESNPAEPTGNAPLVRNGRNWTFDWTSTLSSRMTFNLRAGLARWEETTGNTFGAGYDPRRLGFADAIVSQFTKLQFPRFALGTYQSLGTDRLINYSANDVYTVQPNSNLIYGKHVMKFGGEGRLYNDNNPNPGLASGNYEFLKNWTQANANRADAVSGNELATFLLGYPTSAYVDRNIDPAYRNRYFAFYFNDDWKVTSRLTLNIGLRWDYEAPAVERYDRMLRTFDQFASSPIASQVKGLDLRGAIVFAGINGQPRGAFNKDIDNVQPRFGVAYRIGDKWVLRGGYGIYYLGQNEKGSANGFSRRTNAVTAGVDLKPTVTLENAFANLPGGRLLDAIGTAQGGASFLGEGVGVNWVNRPLPISHQYSFDIERELPGNILAEAAYVGNISQKLPVSASANFIPSSEMGRRKADGTIDSAYYTAAVPNPMAGLLPNNPALNGATIQRQQLMAAFPQYSGLSYANLPIGSQRYDAFQAKLTKRFSRGFTFLSTFTVGKTLERISLLNAQDFVLSEITDTPLEKRSAQQIDTTKKFVFAGVYELPFGKGKWLAGNANRAADLLIGGWQLNAQITYQDGWACDYPNANQVRPGSAALSGGQRSMNRYFDTSLWINPSTGRLVAAQEPFTLRDFPTRFGDVRLPGYQNYDLSLSKWFTVYGEQNPLRAQFRFEMVNALNQPWFSDIASVSVTAANFGQLNPTQRNLPRFIKLALQMTW